MLTIKGKPVRSSSQLSLTSTPYNISKADLSTKTYTFQTDHCSPNISPSPNKNNHHAILESKKYRGLKRSLVYSSQADYVVHSVEREPGRQQLERRIKEQENKNSKLRSQIGKMKIDHERKMNNMNEIILKISQQYDGYDKELKLLNKKAIQMGL